MNFYNYKIRHQAFWPWWRWLLTGLTMLALILSVILSWHYLEGGSMVGCSGGSPCEQVLKSRWSTIGGVLPVSGLAVGVYLSLLVASVYIGQAAEQSLRRLAWSVMLVLAGSIAGSAIWFTIIQRWLVGNFCFYCMTMHITGVLAAALIIWRANREFDPSEETLLTDPANSQSSLPVPPRRMIRPLCVTGLSLTGLVLAGILAAVQMSFTPTRVYLEGESQENLSAVDYHDVPIVGSLEASCIVIMLFDYQCPHCQQIYFMLDAVIRHYNGSIAFALCPAPLSTQCNPFIPRDVDNFKNSCELAKIGMSVWKAKREVFPVFDHWMFTYESGDRWYPRSLEAARAKAIDLVGQAKFDAAWSDPWAGQYMQTGVRIFGQTMQGGNGGIPKLIFGSRWVVPEPQNADDLVMILQKGLGVPEP